MQTTAHVSPNPHSYWLHLGAGAFHRAHQSWYLNQLHQLGDTRWTLALGNIRNSASQATLDQLGKQQGVYTLEVISPDGEIDYQTITAIKTVIPWDAELEQLISVGCDPQTKLISFTVTEGGYFLKDDGHLDLKHPVIIQELTDPSNIATIYGVLVAILRRRMATQAGPVTLLNCDNLRHNGDCLRTGLNDYIAALDEKALAAWCENSISTPNSMVDRITPKSDDALQERLIEQGIHNDNVPVACEAFSQWVIEDDFIAGRPELERVGVEFVDDVIPFEEAKIRVLNASHSGIAWAGSLLGHQSIDESLTPQVREWIRQYVAQDVVAALPQGSIDLNTYCTTTLHRFSNAKVRDTNQRVSSDSIAKLQQFILPTLKTRYKQGDVPKATLVLVALWYLFMQRRAAGTLPFEYQDRALESVPFATIFAQEDSVKAFAQSPALMGTLAEHPTFTEDLRNAVKDVEKTLGDS
ncbi:D-arabinitol 4-dehydrogenase [Rosenbergiella australiborealis]|uniref:D-arabinitol 4-dehydrogenase n=1 Tax=Rosenbergiella australiborealis TaxID=1544696 RepID=UPI001F4E447E|nr:D-arabinitol 4-dehydrogenase [Rosenbergiella australiborealis]